MGRMPGPQEYFWLPRGDAHVAHVEGGSVTLTIVLASYGPGAPSWDVDHFNSLKFFCLQALVGFWSDAKYSVAIKSMRSTPQLVSAVEGHAHKAELDELTALSSSYPEAPTEKGWSAFGAAAERIITRVSIQRRGHRKRTLTFTVEDPAWLAHLGPVQDWCLG